MRGDHGRSPTATGCARFCSTTWSDRHFIPNGVVSPKKTGGLKNCSLLVSSKSYNIHTWDTLLYIYNKTCQRISSNFRRGLNKSGGSGPTHSPRGDATVHGLRAGCSVSNLFLTGWLGLNCRLPKMELIKCAREW